MSDSAAPRVMPPQVQAALYMLAATVFFSIMVTSIRHVSAEVDSFIVVFFRNLFGALIIAPIVAPRGIGYLRTSKLKLYGWRTALGLGSMMMWFYAVSVTPVAEAVALSFTSPLFVTVIAVFLLGEKAGLPRWIATAVGFGGAMLVLRPGIVDITLGHLLLLASSVLMAGSIIAMKMLSRTEPPERIVAYMILLFTPVALIPALFVWEWPSWSAMFWLVVIASAGTVAHIMFTRALSKADASAVMPLDFMRLPFTAIIGYLAFSEVPDVFTLTGGAIIFVSSIYIARRENRDRAARQRIAAPAAGQD